MHAGTGRLNVILVGILAFLPAVIGDNIGFAVERFGRFILITPDRLDKQPASSNATAAKS